MLIRFGDGTRKFRYCWVSDPLALCARLTQLQSVVAPSHAQSFHFTRDYLRLSHSSLTTKRSSHSIFDRPHFIHVVSTIAHPRGSRGRAMHCLSSGSFLS